MPRRCPGRQRAKVDAAWRRCARAHSLLAAGFAVACAHEPARPTRVAFQEPMVVTAGPPEQRQLGDLDDAALFDGGTRAFAAGDFAKAALHFDRLVATFPDSAQRLPALFDAALCQERLGNDAGALQRLTRYLELAPKDIDAQLHAALAEYKLGKRADAARRLEALAARADVPARRKVEALVQQGVCLVEDGKRAAGAEVLRGALKLFDGIRDEPVEAALAAQADFWLGETYRAQFAEARLDPASMDGEALSAALETKAQFLLSAQGHYLRAIRRGDGEWATAAGFRIGELYESFHDELQGAPAPRGLTGAQVAVYRDEVQKKVRVLVEKAIRIYEETLATAQRVGAQGGYVKRTQEALERMKKLLLPAS